MDIWLVRNSTLSSTTDNMLQLLGLILLFCFVLAATYLTSKFVGQNKLGQMKNKNFKILETIKVAPNKYLQIMKVGKKYIVISIGKDDVRYITELSEEEIEMPIEGEQQGIKFSDLITKVQKIHSSTKEHGSLSNEKELECKEQNSKEN